MTTHAKIKQKTHRPATSKDLLATLALLVKEHGEDAVINGVVKIFGIDRSLIEGGAK